MFPESFEPVPLVPLSSCSLAYWCNIHVAQCTWKRRSGFGITQGKTQGSFQSRRKSIFLLLSKQSMFYIFLHNIFYFNCYFWGVWDKSCFSIKFQVQALRHLLNLAWEFTAYEWEKLSLEFSVHLHQVNTACLWLLKGHWGCPTSLSLLFVFVFFVLWYLNTNHTIQANL